MDANTRTLQCHDLTRGCDEQYFQEEDEMVEWTCDICGEKYIDGVSGDAEERMCYSCMEELDKEEENREK